MTTVGNKLRQRIDTVARAVPEARPWLALYEATLHAEGDPVWTAAVPEPRSRRDARAPLLTETVIALAPRVADEWVTHLVEVARAGEWPESGLALQAWDPGRLDALALLESSINHDLQALRTLATAAGAEAEPLIAIAGLAARPLLQATRAALARSIPLQWTMGYCPVCAAWPTIAEMRGLEGTRHLRCGRCGADWMRPGLRCLYCDNADHLQLGMLAPDGERESRRVEVCKACRGYVKTVTTLSAWAPAEIMLADLSTLELDLAALDREYSAPTQLGYPLNVRVVPGGVVQARR